MEQKNDHEANSSSSINSDKKDEFQKLWHSINICNEKCWFYMLLISGRAGWKIFLCIKSNRCERERKAERAQKHKQQFSGSSSSSDDSAFMNTKNGNFIQEEFRKNNGNVWAWDDDKTSFSFLDDAHTLCLILCRQIWSVRFSRFASSREEMEKKTAKRKKIFVEKFQSRQFRFLHEIFKFRVFECSHMCILFQPSELITCKKVMP